MDVRLRGHAVSSAGPGSSLRPTRTGRRPLTLGSARKALVHRLVKAAHHVLSLPPTSPDRVCVWGTPDFEENSLVAAAALAGTGSFRVTLLARRPERARRYLALAADRDLPIDIVRKRSLLGLLRASRARVLLFTHGLYGAPDLTRHKTVVNLWHGFGPKATSNSSFALRIRSTVMTCNTPVWAGAAARALGAPDARLLRTGNPRQVNMRRPSHAQAWERLGLRQGSYVLWMPTYRSSNGSSGQAWRDAPDLSEQRAGGHGLDPVSGLARLAASVGVEIVVKPHPLDADRFERDGLRVVTTEQVFDSGMTLYQFIGSAAGMISDYSSVWVEYLDVDRPLLLFCPDLADYREGRGLSRPLMTEVAKDLTVERVHDVRPFLQAVARGDDWRPQARTAVRSALGLEDPAVRPESFATALLSDPALQRPGTTRRLPRRPPRRP
ncbi:CDP-glycerol glycerophosphotransferase family protein [Blastococcus sp. SYSU D00695]